MPEIGQRKQKVKRKKSISNNIEDDPERFLYAKLRRKHSRDYVDPFKAGPVAMAKYVDAMMEFMRKSYSDTMGNSNLYGLLTRQLVVKVSEGPEVSVSYESQFGRAIISIPKIPNESPEDEDLRRIRVAQDALPILPKGIFEVLSEMIRGMPKEGLKRLLAHHPTKQK